MGVGVHDVHLVRCAAVDVAYFDRRARLGTADLVIDGGRPILVVHAQPQSRPVARPNSSVSNPSDVDSLLAIASTINSNTSPALLESKCGHSAIWSSRTFRIASATACTTSLVADTGERLADQLPVTEQSRAWINNFLDAVAIARQDFWDEKIVCSPGKIDKDSQADILTIGPREVVGASVRVAVRDGFGAPERIRYLAA